MRINGLWIGLLAIGCGTQASDLAPDGGALADSDLVLDTGRQSDTASADTSPLIPDATPALDSGLWSGGALDDTLRFNQLQALGTHNSYHQRPRWASDVAAWDYQHLPLDQQAELQGVRQFELDIYWNKATQGFDVVHLPAIDPETSCAELGECLAVLKTWSDAHRTHHPLMVLIEPKFPFQAALVETQIQALEARVLDVWPQDRLVTPDLVRGDSQNLAEGLKDHGWPTLGVLRGRLMLVFHTDGPLRDALTHGGTSTAGRLLFADAFGDVTLPFAAYHSMNDPLTAQDAISAVVMLGHLVRTRADADSEEALAVDFERWQAALQSGAQFVTTDYPGRPFEAVYAVDIPDGTPSRCNPKTALQHCTPADIESGLFSGF